MAGPVEEYLNEIQVNPNDYDSEVEASLAFPIELRLLEETDQKYKVTFDERGDRVYYEQRLGNGRIGNTNTVEFSWKDRYKSLQEDRSKDTDVELVSEVSEAIFQDMISKHGG